MKSLCAIVILFAPCCVAQNYPALSVYAGTPLDTGFSGDGGQAVSASLANPIGIAVDSKGNLYIADQCNNRVRKVDPTGVITTVAGSGNSQGICGTGTGGYSGDGGAATAAQLNGPTHVAVDSAGNLYITDSGNQVIRKVNTTGIISTYAGGGTASPGNGGPATSAYLSTLVGGLAVDALGNLYVADGNSMIREVTPGGTITTVAGTINSGYSGDGGSATQATLSNPADVAVDSSGNLYIADTANCVIRKVSGGIITTVAGTNASCGFYFTSSGDGGPATSAQLNLPWGIAVDSAKNLYIGVPGANNVREVFASSGTIQTIVAGGEQYLYKGTQGSSPIREPENYGVAIIGGTLYVSDHFYDVVWTLTVSGTVMGGGPSITPGGIVPIYGSTSTIQPGSWVSIYGNNLITGSTPANWTGNYPTTLGGTTVMINNKPAYLSYAAPTIINLEAPDDTARGTVNLTVTTSSGSISSTVTLADQSPSFSLLGDAKHVAAIILRPDGSGAFGSGANSYDIVGPAGNSLGYQTVPAKAGDTVVIFGVGFGPTNPAVAAGQQFTTGAPPPTATDSIALRINGQPVTQSFSGLSAPGLFQFNVTVPSGLGTGDQPIVATVNGVSTQQNVVIALQ